MAIVYAAMDIGDRRYLELALRLCILSCRLWRVICGMGTEERRIRIKPDTADARILSIDGGGIRGRGPLEFLRVLEEMIDLPVSVPRQFDVVFGTSSGRHFPGNLESIVLTKSGAMTVCALCLNGWAEDRCVEYFELSSRLAFDTNHLFRVVAPLVGDVPILSPLLQFLSSLLVDSKYSAERLESIQKDAYGESRSIVDSNAADEMGIALGVALTTTDDASTCIAKNYNGVGCRTDATGTFCWVTINSITDTGRSRLYHLDIQQWGAQRTPVGNVSTMCGEDTTA